MLSVLSVSVTMFISAVKIPTVAYHDDAFYQRSGRYLLSIRSIYAQKIRPFCPNFSGNKVTRMWANAQRDGRRAEYRWRPLFNAAKYG